MERQLLSRAAAFFASEKRATSPAVTYAFIAVGEGHQRRPCSVVVPGAGVSAAGFYDWQRRQAGPFRRARDDAALTETVREIHRQSRIAYGPPRAHAELRLGRGIAVAATR